MQNAERSFVDEMIPSEKRAIPFFVPNRVSSVFEFRDRK